MKERTTYSANIPLLVRRVKLEAAPPETATVSGIEVREEKWCTVTAQHVYKMRCECGRSWFELELPRLVKCPACDKLGLVNT